MQRDAVSMLLRIPLDDVWDFQARRPGRCMEVNSFVKNDAFLRVVAEENIIVIEHP